MTYWQRWMRQPQTAWLRRAIFQLHLWSGIGIGLYVLLVSVTGSVLIYRNELFRAAIRDPIIVTASGPRLTDEQLTRAATRAYPGYAVIDVSRYRNPDQAVSVSLERGTDLKIRLFNPYTGEDLGDSVPLAFWLVSKLIELHDDLLGGRTGRAVNGVGALLIDRPRMHRNGRVVAGDQDVATKPDCSQECRVATLHLGLAQHDRLLDLWIHLVVCGKRGLSR